MPVTRIAYEDEVPRNHHARLTEGQELVPAGDVIQLVHGDGAEPASFEFLQRLKDAATLLGDHTDAVRAVVKQNADALKSAAEALHDADDTSATALRSTTAIIDQTAADTTHEDVQGSQRFLTQEATTGSAGDAGAAERPSTVSTQTQQDRAAGPNL